MINGRELMDRRPWAASPAAEVVGAARDQTRIWPQWALYLLGAVALLEMAWLALTPLSLSAERSAGVVNGFITAALAVLVLGRIALPPRIHMLISGLAFVLVAWPLLRIYNHLVMTVPMPLADPVLSAADQALGFDWVAYVRWADAQPQLLMLMAWAYRGLTAYSVAAFVLILFLVSVERAREFVLLFLLTALAASTAGLFFPAEAAMIHYHPDPNRFHQLTALTGTYHIDMLRQLRSDASHVLALDQLPGLTTFPSFHTAMGVLCIWCSRGSRWIFPPMLIDNLVMIASTPVFGSHYLVDIISGTILAVAVICFLRWLESGRPLRP